MKFSKHTDYEGKHAKFGASKPAWANYTEDKMIATFYSMQDAAKGTELHEFAAFAIKLGKKLERRRTTLNMYVNDCIGFGMNPEVVLLVNDFFFGTADAIKLETKRNKRPLLRIFDLKTGKTAAKFPQLRIYSAFFCLEYGFSPLDLDYDLRIYQNDEIFVDEDVDATEILYLMNQITTFTRILTEMATEEL